MKKFKPQIKKRFINIIKEALFKDIKIKVVCFGLAFATFVVISFVQTNEKVFSCPLNIKGLKENFVISNQLPETIKVTVKNKQSIIDKIVESDFNIRVDLTKIDTPNTYTIKIDWDIPKPMQSFFNSFLFTSVTLNPDKLLINMELLSEKSVPIVLNLSGDIAKGYTLKQKTIDAYSVRIQGPEKIINTIKYIETEKVNIEGETESFKRTLNLVSPSPLVKFIGRNKVEVFFEITRDLEFITYKFENLSIHNLNTNLKVELINPSIFYVQISGGKEDIKKISKENIIISIDCSPVHYPGEYSFRIDVSLPKNINLVSIRPEVVKVNIKSKY